MPCCGPLLSNFVLLSVKKSISKTVCQFCFFFGFITFYFLKYKFCIFLPSFILTVGLLVNLSSINLHLELSFFLIKFKIFPSRLFMIYVSYCKTVKRRYVYFKCVVIKTSMKYIFLNKRFLKVCMVEYVLFI